MTEATRASRLPAGAVADVYAFAVLQWPAVIGLFELGGEGWQLAGRIALAAWLALMQLAAYRRGHGRFFGNSMLLLAGCVAAFWWTHPGPWMYLWLALIPVGMYAAQTRTLTGAGRGADASSAATRASPQDCSSA
jgi:hypothetical protein